MDAQIWITGGTGGELAALSEWLRDENELRGRVRTVHSPIGDTELGSVTELLTVALGAGGVGTVLASSLKTWLDPAALILAAVLTVSCPQRMQFRTEAWAEQDMRK